MTRASIFAEGEIQGVGFRQTVADTARELGLLGLVRNLSDGRVQIFLEGQKETILEFARTIKTREGSIKGLYPKVERLSVAFEGENEFRDAWKSYTGFEIDVKHHWA